MPKMPDPQRRLARIKGRARANSEKTVPAKVRAYLSGSPLNRAPQVQSNCPADGKTERRASERVETKSEITVRRLGGFNFSVALGDISTGGCRVEMLEPSEVGDPVVARLPQLEPLGSRVCWTRGVTAGVQFSTTIHPAVFDMLLTRLNSADATDAAA